MHPSARVRGRLTLRRAVYLRWKMTAGKARARARARSTRRGFDGATTERRGRRPVPRRHDVPFPPPRETLEGRALRHPPARAPELSDDIMAKILTLVARAADGGVPSILAAGAVCRSWQRAARSPTSGATSRESASGSATTSATVSASSPATRLTASCVAASSPLPRPPSTTSAVDGGAPSRTSDATASHSAIPRRPATRRAATTTKWTTPSRRAPRPTPRGVHGRPRRARHGRVRPRCARGDVQTGDAQTKRRRSSPREARGFPRAENPLGSDSSHPRGRGRRLPRGPRRGEEDCPPTPRRGEEGCPPTPRRRRRRRRLLRVVLQGERRRDGDGDGGRVRSGPAVVTDHALALTFRVDPAMLTDIMAGGDRVRVTIEAETTRRPDSPTRTDSHRLAGGSTFARLCEFTATSGFAFRPSTTREVPARILVDGAAFLSARAPAAFTHEYFHPARRVRAGSKNRRRRRRDPREDVSPPTAQTLSGFTIPPPLLATGVAPDAVAGTSNDAVARVAGAYVLAVSFTSHREMDALRASPRTRGVLRRATSRGDAHQSPLTSSPATRVARVPVPRRNHGSDLVTFKLGDARGGVGDARARTRRAAQEMAEARCHLSLIRERRSRSRHRVRASGRFAPARTPTRSDGARVGDVRWGDARGGARVARRELRIGLRDAAENRRGREPRGRRLLRLERGRLERGRTPRGNQTYMGTRGGAEGGSREGRGGGGGTLDVGHAAALRARARLNRRTRRV